jgi:hypothetical protein
LRPTAARATTRIRTARARRAITARAPQTEAGLTVRARRATALRATAQVRRRVQRAAGRVARRVQRAAGRVARQVPQDLGARAKKVRARPARLPASCAGTTPAPIPRCAANHRILARTFAFPIVASVARVPTISSATTTPGFAFRVKVPAALARVVQAARARVVRARVVRTRVVRTRVDRAKAQAEQAQGQGVLVPVPEARVRDPAVQGRALEVRVRAQADRSAAVVLPPEARRSIATATTAA